MNSQGFLQLVSMTCLVACVFLTILVQPTESAGFFIAAIITGWFSITAGE